jgi:hypothetical protein
MVLLVTLLRHNVTTFFAVSYTEMADGDAVSDNHSEYLMHNETYSMWFTCANCVHMKNKLQNMLLELNSAQLIIEILQKQISTGATHEHVNTDRLGTKFCEQNNH